ncbi:MAG: bifunctional glutamate N-acetyltransferase/amino-acid acetyltransferase ArgJ [Chloroflexota bacterium]|nr:MAG: bifunctional glutamate N-acetyltransferase/amino-acid acetyltransferase ArgJ [Chloroflexota bacterium]
MELIADAAITDVTGFTAGSVHAGIKKDGQSLDLCIIYSLVPATAAGVFTRNKVRAAPVTISEQRLKNGRCQAIVVNAGNANCCTGKRGHADAERMIDLTARKLGIDPSDVVVASTGVIGVHLPMDRVEPGIDSIVLRSDGGADAARAIMTTDTRSKMAGARLRIDGKTITIAGIAKGSGMIHPNMATMLGFLVTDAAVAPDYLRRLVGEAADESFNQMTVDGDTSTNDSLIVLANGQAGNRPIDSGHPAAATFKTALTAVAADLARAIARDGEGATKFIEMIVEGAVDAADARRAAKAVVSSSLVKTAVYGADPNWGRILCAMGYSGAQIEESKVDLRIGDVWLMRGGEIQAFDRDQGVSALGGPDVEIWANLNLGSGVGRAWGCDLTEGYIDINGRYTT